MKVGERIRAARVARGLTVPELAERLKRGQQSVYRWEWGKVIPRVDDVERIARALDVPLSELLPDTTKKSAPRAAR